MAGGKRLRGADAAVVAAAYGSVPPNLSYDQFVSLHQNAATAHAVRSFHAAVAAAVGSGGQQFPDDWIDAAVPDPAEAARWRTWDLRRTRPAPR